MARKTVHQEKLPAGKGAAAVLLAQKQKPAVVPPERSGFHPNSAMVVPVRVVVVVVMQMPKGPWVPWVESEEGGANRSPGRMTGLVAGLRLEELNWLQVLIRVPWPCPWRNNGPRWLFGKADHRKGLGG